LLLTMASFTLLFTSVFFSWPRAIREYFADGKAEEVSKLLQELGKVGQISTLVEAVDRANGGQELAVGTGQIARSPFVKDCVQAITSGAESSANRLAALTILEGYDCRPVKEMCSNREDRSNETQVAKLLSALAPKDAPNLESWLVRALASADP